MFLLPYPWMLFFFFFFFSLSRALHCAHSGKKQFERFPETLKQQMSALLMCAGKAGIATAPGEVVDPPRPQHGCCSSSYMLSAGLLWVS